MYKKRCWLDKVSLLTIAMLFGGWCVPSFNLFKLTWSQLFNSKRTLSARTSSLRSYLLRLEWKQEIKKCWFGFFYVRMFMFILTYKSNANVEFRTCLLYTRHVLGWHDREILSDVYSKRQTSGWNWEFPKTENEQLKTVQNNCYSQNKSEDTNFGVEVMNSKAQVKEKSWSRGTNSRLPFAVKNVSFTSSSGSRSHCWSWTL